MRVGQWQSVNSRAVSRGSVLRIRIERPRKAGCREENFTEHKYRGPCEHAKTEPQIPDRNCCFLDGELRLRAEFRFACLSQSFPASGTTRRGPGAPHDGRRKGQPIDQPIASHRALAYTRLQLVE